MSNIYRVGIAGAGFGVAAHLPALLAHPRFDVVALASPNTAAAIAKARGIAHAFTSCAAMIEGVDLDAVVIASPPFAHRDDVLAATRARKHVICEKPFALNLAQANEMLAAAREAGIAAGVAHEFRFVPQRAALRELIANGHLAPLREIEVTQLGTSLRAGAARPRSWWFEKRLGGGVAGALVSHLIDTANWLAGRSPVTSIGFLRTANAQRRDANGPFTTDVDDGAFALLNYGEGLVARITADAATAVESVTLAVHAENRTAVASGSDLDDMRLFAVDADETSELDCKESPYAKFASIGGNVPLLMELYDEWVKAIEQQPHALPTFENAVDTQRVLEAIGYTTAG